MKPVALLLAALALAPTVLAAPARTESMRYTVVDDGPARFVTLVGGEEMGVNGAMFSPRAGETRVTVDVRDASGARVAVGVCHEWTYDEGNHPSVTCLKRACEPLVDTPLVTRPPGADYYRIVVFLFDEPWGCASRATTGAVVATFR